MRQDQLQENRSAAPRLGLFQPDEQVGVRGCVELILKIIIGLIVIAWFVSHWMGERQETPMACSPDQGKFAELAGLLQKAPVSIRKSPKRVYLAETRKWARQNWEMSKRISELVFLEPEIFAYIENHPAETITGENFLSEIT